MASSLLQALIFPPPPSLFVTAMSVISVASLAYSGMSEVGGKHLQYSKFWTSSNANSLVGVIGGGGAKVSSRAGMFVLYVPAALAAAAAMASFYPALAAAPRGLMLASVLAVHFSKRVLEVLFVHQYSGQMVLDSVLPISFSYFISTVTMIYAQYLTRGMPEPPVDLKSLGLLLFLVGLGGNFYHHHLLANLRDKDDKGYKIPKGGLFGLVICPHYLFEIIGFIGITYISQTLYALSFTLGTTFYLMGRSYATRKWYLSKFENFPREVKCLIPYVY